MTLTIERTSSQKKSGANSRPARRIIVAEAIGYCFGVRRAVEIAQQTRREQEGAVTVLGPLVHNNQVIERMAAQGVETLPRLDEITTGTVVLSAHGVASTIPLQARDQGLNVVDATCPFVTKAHRMARLLHEQGYQILLVGDPGHTEVKGIIGTVEALGGTITLVSTPDDVRALALNNKVGVVSQTTQRNETFCAIVAEVCRRAGDVRAINTICGATDELQDAARKLARQTEIVLVVGGRNSANTRRLRDLCEEMGTPAYHIETPEQINDDWLEGKTVVGLTAGASTPDWIIEDVARYVNGGTLPADWRIRNPE